MPALFRTLLLALITLGLSACGETETAPDNDGDGHAADVDCNDDNAAVHPGATEVCNGADDDCDGGVDVGAVDADETFADADEDGYGDPVSGVSSCTVADSRTLDDGDCDDEAPGVHPGADETCNGVDDNCDGSVDNDASDAGLWFDDADGDGFGDPLTASAGCTGSPDAVVDGTDCDDTVATVHPGAEEVCDGLDNDCDGALDEDTDEASAWYADTDGDGAGDATASVMACAQPPCYVADNSDCDDADAAVHPSQRETCDGLDDDCDGVADDSALDAGLWYADGDGDGVGAGVAVTACDAPAGHVALDGDCDDAVATVSPLAAETCNGVDDDCDSDVDEDVVGAPTWYVDADGDGAAGNAVTRISCDQPVGYAAAPTDCDDGAANIGPAADEVCDGVDNDCEGTVDVGAIDEATWYEDDDGDLHGDTVDTTTACSQPVGYVATTGDCDDSDATVHPGALEQCDGEDDDCDGLADEEAVDPGQWFADGDGDGVGDGPAITACDAPAGHVAEPGDCDDGDDASYPGALELCDGADNDCDGVVDDSPVNTDTWYLDHDEDGFGDASHVQDACAQPTGYVNNDLDCDDTDASAHLGADELCDGVDNDCDGSVDEDAVDRGTWYADADGDQHGDPDVPVLACEAPADHVALDDDCDDSDPWSFAGAPERCDGADNDCDSATDEDALDMATWYADSDTDLYGDPNVTRLACDQPAGYVDNNLDCDDLEVAINPAADELCDGGDENCDGLLDVGAVDMGTWHLDLDGDGYGGDETVEACTQPPGSWPTATDCDDLDAMTFPGADEYCDGGDNNCGGVADENPVDEGTWYADVDGDLYGDPDAVVVSCTPPADHVANNLDCDDATALSRPGAVEICDGDDNDCDGFVDNNPVDPATWYADSDGDTFGDALVTQVACEAPADFVDNPLDCDDGDSDVFPGAVETCDNVDTNCDGTFDEGDAVDATQWYTDADADGFGDAAQPLSACNQPLGYVLDDTDCRDDDATAYPGSTHTETPLDGIDTDCDGNDSCTDLNCDGLVDLFLGQHYDGNYSTNSHLFFNEGIGYSDASHSTVPTVGEHDAKVADLDGDGYQDIVVANYYNGTTRRINSYVYWGSAAGYSAGDRTDLPTLGALAVEVADLDGDGWLDLVFANYYDGSNYNLDSYIYWGSAAGYSVSDRSGLPTQGARKLLIEDFDQDSFVDVAFCDYASADSTYDTNSYVYWGAAGGYSPAERSNLPTHGCRHLTSSDLDGDGYSELVLANYVANGSDYTTDSYIYWGTPSRFTATNRTALPTQGTLGVAAGDFDGDGDTDLAFSGYYNARWSNNAYGYAYWNVGGVFGTGSRTQLHSKGYRRLVAADLDGDGFDDLVAPRYYTGSSNDTNSVIYWGSVSGLSTTDITTLPSRGAVSVAVGDIDGDGMMDIVSPNYYAGSWSTGSPSYIYWGLDAAPWYGTTDRTTLSTWGTHDEPVFVGTLY